MGFDGITTKMGDDGLTGLFGGDRVSKDDCVIEAMGAEDELCSWLGLIKAEMRHNLDVGYVNSVNVSAQLEDIQRELFKIGSELATKPVGPLRAKINLLEDAALGRLEEYEKELMQYFELSRDFILPGASAISAKTDIARAVARRLERVAVRVCKEYPQRLRVETVIPYLNRLSDYLFALARFYEQK